MSVYKELELAVIKAVRQMRKDIGSLESHPTHLDFDINVNGRVLDGDMEIKYVFEGGYSRGTSGGNMENTLEEYMRRHGWSRRNAPLCLPNTVDNIDRIEDGRPDND